MVRDRRGSVSACVAAWCAVVTIADSTFAGTISFELVDRLVFDEIPWQLQATPDRLAWKLTVPDVESACICTYDLRSHTVAEVPNSRSQYSGVDGLRGSDLLYHYCNFSVGDPSGNGYRLRDLETGQEQRLENFPLRLAGEPGARYIRFNEDYIVAVMDEDGHGHELRLRWEDRHTGVARTSSEPIPFGSVYGYDMSLLGQSVFFVEGEFGSSPWELTEFQLADQQCTRIDRAWTIYSHDDHLLLYRDDGGDAQLYDVEARAKLGTVELPEMPWDIQLDWPYLLCGAEYYVYRVLFSDAVLIDLRTGAATTVVEGLPGRLDPALSGNIIAYAHGRSVTILRIVPEPATEVLLVVASTSVLVRRRRLR